MRRTIVLLLAVLFGLPTAAAGAGAKPGKAVFAHGTSPAGERWSAEASVTPSRRNHDWKFEMEWHFSNGFNWGVGQEIPTGGREQMAGQASGYTGLLSGPATESGAFGYAGPEVTTIKMKMNDGSSLEVHPVFPPAELRRKYVWMRGFRYFMKFYEGGAYVTEYWLYDAAGKRVGCETYAEGELGPSVCGTRPYGP